MKKTLALIMAAALAGSSLAGCGGKADNSSAGDQTGRHAEADNGGGCTGRGNGRVPGHRYGRCTCYGKGND